MKKRVHSPHPIRCSFCGRGQDEVSRLVSGPSVYICSECVKLCNDILEGETDHAAGLPKGSLPKPAESTAPLSQVRTRSPPSSLSQASKASKSAVTKTKWASAHRPPSKFS